MEEKPYASKQQLGTPTWLNVNNGGGASSSSAAASASSSAPPPPPIPSSSSSASPSSHPPPPSSALLSSDRPQKWCGCDQPGSQCVQCSFLHLQAPPPNSSAAAAVATLDLPPKSNHLPRAPPSDAASDMLDGGTTTPLHGGHHQQQTPPSPSSWTAHLKAQISMHPLYSHLLAAHVACLRIATPVDQLPRIDAQIEQAPHIIAKYHLLAAQFHHHPPPQTSTTTTTADGMLRHDDAYGSSDDKEELDQFMAQYVFLLCTFKEQLQQHVRVHAMEAVMACWELEQSLLTLTGVSPGEGTGATMSDDEDMDGGGEGELLSMYDASFDGHDSGAFGPLIPTETERTLMERVRQELKNELKNGYKDRIVDVREEILRKRRAGKLPGDTTSVLKAWWHAHSKWPYPTEDEKARLVQETGLQLKQINNWFINQRKRNWHNNPSSTASLKTKRKS